MCEESQGIAKYSCSQLFGYKSKSQKLLEEDNITTVKFDPTGAFLALGDRAGRLIIFHSPEKIQSCQQYDYYYEFEAHHPNFDTLKNLNISEEILDIHWLRPQGKYMKLLTGNTHTVKLWKLYEKEHHQWLENWSQDLVCPPSEEETTVRVNLQRSFSNTSYSPICSFGLTNNEQYLFTAEEQSMLLWSLQKNATPYVIHKINENSQHPKSNKITCAQVHPTNESLFAVGTNHGSLNVLDSRESIIHPNSLHFVSSVQQNSFISEIIKQYTSVNFLSDSKKIVTRDLISVKVWDMCYNRQPLHTIYIDEEIKQHLPELFQAEVLEDRFRITEANNNVVTGNYGNSFHIMDPNNGDNVHYELDFGQQTKTRKVGDGKRNNPFSCNSRVFGHDFNESTGQLAVSTSSCFFIFSQGNQEEEEELVM